MAKKAVDTAADLGAHAPAQGRGGRAGGMLSVVGTPIGNLSDAAPRSIEALRGADVVYCEDTRVTSRLLASFGVQASLRRADENVLERRVAEVVERLAAGERVAFVSDAGMPCVSDPGQRLVDAVLDAGFEVEVVPGPSAVTCAIAASGLHAEHFFFEGFLPRKEGACVARLTELAAIPGALVFYESARRVPATLACIAHVLSGRRVALLRELTKLHEECLRGEATELAERVSTRVAELGELRGECVLVVERPSADELRTATVVDEQTLDDAIRDGLAAGEPKSALAKRLAKERRIPRGEVYDRIVELS